MIRILSVIVDEMPLIYIKDYIWKQNNLKILITVPLKYVTLSKVNIVSTEEFLKIYLAPYIFQLVLLHKVDHTKTKCVLRDHQVQVELTKIDSLIWESLSRGNITKEELIKLKEDSVRQEQKRTEDERKKKEKEKRERKKMYSICQMDIRKAEMDIINMAKNKEKMRGLEELTKLEKENNLKSGKVNENSKLSYVNVRQLPVPVPFPRSAGTIKFNFSTRVLPTPKRESLKKEEEEWLRKEVEAKRISEFFSENLTEEERNPSWVLEKGMSFLKNDNYLGAVNVFSYGIKLAPKIPAFYSKMALVQLKLKQYSEAIEYSTKALELLLPVVPKNKVARAETYEIRAEALKYLNKHDLSNEDFKSAKSLK